MSGGRWGNERGGKPVWGGREVKWRRASRRVRGGRGARGEGHRESARHPNARATHPAAASRRAVADVLRVLATRRTRGEANAPPPMTTTSYGSWAVARPRWATHEPTMERGALVRASDCCGEGASVSELDEWRRRARGGHVGLTREDEARASMVAVVLGGRAEGEENGGRWRRRLVSAETRTATTTALALPRSSRVLLPAHARSDSVARLLGPGPERRAASHPPPPPTPSSLVTSSSPSGGIQLVGLARIALLALVQL